jgi:DNA-binding GntR family transcriptional regulator
MALVGSAKATVRDGRIARRSLHDEVVERLRDMIIEGELSPGARVPERELCERFGISRTPLREALKVLATEGLIDLLPNRGARIALLSEEDIDKLFEVLSGLEGLAGELACRRIGRRELMAVRRAHEAMLRAYERGDLSAYFKLNQEIHGLIVAAAGNATLKEVYDSLAGRIRQARFAANLSAERWRQAVAEHEAILEALEARDGERLEKLLKAHLRNKAEVIKHGYLSHAASASADETALRHARL